jgi:hypothetical protein
MVRSFYLPRWKIFLHTLDVALAEGKPVDEAKLESELRDFDLAWTEAVDPWPAEARGDPVEIARALWETRGRRVAHEPDSPSLTTGKPVTCSAFLPPHTPQRANDGRTLSSDRYWATDVSTDPAAWWQVDLEEPTRVGRAVLVFYHGDVRSYGFRLEGSLDGMRWETLAERKDDDPAPASRAGTSFSFVARPVRYLRVTVTSNSANTGRHLVEVMAFER